MKQLLSLLLCACLLLGAFAIAEPTGEGYPPYDYLVSKGYQPEYLQESPGWRTCNLMGGDGWWSISFSDEVTSWSIMVLPQYSPGFNFTEFARLFLDLVVMFDWDISFYWPDYDSGSKMAASYKIVNDIANTNENYMEKEPYIEALRVKLGLDPASAVSAAAADAVPAGDPAPATSAAPVYAELRKGSKGADVVKLQTRLKELGFLSGLADGDFGPATERAVTAFESANGLPADGVASPDDQAVLFGDGVIDAGGKQAGAYDPYARCPIEISKVDLRDGYGINYVTFNAKNVSVGNVKAVSFSVRYFDAFGTQLSDYSASEQVVKIANIPVGKTATGSTYDDYSLIVSDAETAQVAVTRVLMEDGTDIYYDELVWFEGN